MDDVAVHVEEPSREDCVRDDRRARSGFPEAQVAAAVPGEVKDADLQGGAEPDHLAAAQLHVDGNVGAHRVAKPGRRVGRVADPVGRVPAVPFSQDPLAVADPGRVVGVRAEERRGRGRTDRRVAPEVVDVGM